MVNPAQEYRDVLQNMRVALTILFCLDDESILDNSKCQYTKSSMVLYKTRRISGKPTKRVMFNRALEDFSVVEFIYDNGYSIQFDGHVPSDDLLDELAQNYK